MTTENALAGGDATSAQVSESTAPATDEAQNTSAPDTQAEQGSQTDANSDGKSSEGKNPGESDAAQEKTGQDQTSKSKPPSQRIAELTRNWRGEERRANEEKHRADALEREVARLSRPLQVRHDMTEDERSALSARQGARDEMRDKAEADAKDARQAAESAEHERRVRRQETFEEKVRPVLDRMPGVLDKFYALKGVTDDLADFIVESEQTAELANYFANNPNEGRRVANLSGVRQGTEMARIEGRLSSPNVVRRISQAPAPSETRLKGGSSPAAFDPAKAGVEDYAARLKKAGLIQ